MGRRRSGRRPVFGFEVWRGGTVVAAVGMWESRAVCEIPKGRWKEWETRVVVFHSFHGPGISTACLGLCQRKRGGGSGDSILQTRSSLALDALIFLANSVSLMVFASRSNVPRLIPS